MGADMGDMKQLLLRLGHQLVEKHGYGRAGWAASCRGQDARNVEPLFRFLIWIDGSSEAREELEELGFSFDRGPAVARD